MMVWLGFEPSDPLDPASKKTFRCSWTAHVRETRRRDFGTYREALDFATRKAGKGGAIDDSVPECIRRPPLTASELTPAGEQLVIPGCERMAVSGSRKPRQGTLWD